MSDYTYTLDGSNNATITGYTGAGGDITIPSTLDGHPVVAIGEYVFRSSITGATIPVGVTSIGNGAFADSSLTSITFPNSVISIDDNAFNHCVSLVSAIFMGNAPTFVHDNSNPFDNTALNFTIYYQQGTTGWTNPWYRYPTQRAGSPNDYYVNASGSQTFPYDTPSKGAHNFVELLSGTGLTDLGFSNDNVIVCSDIDQSGPITGPGASYGVAIKMGSAHVKSNVKYTKRKINISGYHFHLLNNDASIEDMILYSSGVDAVTVMVSRRNIKLYRDEFYSVLAGGLGVTAVYLDNWDGIQPYDTDGVEIINCKFHHLRGWLGNGSFTMGMKFVNNTVWDMENFDITGDARAPIKMINNVFQVPSAGCVFGERNLPTYLQENNNYINAFFLGESFTPGSNDLILTDPAINVLNSNGTIIQGSTVPVGIGPSADADIPLDDFNGTARPNTATSVIGNTITPRAHSFPNMNAVPNIHALTNSNVVFQIELTGDGDVASIVVPHGATAPSADNVVIDRGDGDKNAAIAAAIIVL
jgi:hypothetical protein